jgi:hypothetical protein
MPKPKRSAAGGARTPSPLSSNATAERLDAAVRETRAWVGRAVVGLGLCPFAAGVESSGRVRYIGCAATEAEALLDAFCAEVERLVSTPASDLETTLLVHPFVLDDFTEYNDFLDVVDGAIEALGCAGVVQVASFHPHYRFAGSEPDDVTNATNRSPYPLLQLLREASIERAVDTFGDTSAIYARNMKTLEALGTAGWASLQERCRRDAEVRIPVDPASTSTAPAPDD